MKGRLEINIEQRLKNRLEGKGFKVLKLTTPGTNGVMDRLILRPLWSPGQPWFVECKQAGKEERLLQAHTRDEWRKRGVLVLDRCDSYARADEIFEQLMEICVRERIDV